MASSLEWDDDQGAGTLTNGYPAPGDRFAAWETDSPLMGVEAEALADGTLHVFEFHVKYVATFELRDIPQDQWRLAMRLVRHLNRGGEVTVNTGDSEGNTYTCQKLKGSQPSLGKPDPNTLRRTLKLTLRNTDTDDMVCIWP
jgi:hypothetical protein